MCKQLFSNNATLFSCHTSKSTCQNIFWMFVKIEIDYFLVFSNARQEIHNFNSLNLFLKLYMRHVAEHTSVQSSNSWLAGVYLRHRNHKQIFGVQFFQRNLPTYLNNHLSIHQSSFNKTYLQITLELFFFAKLAIISVLFQHKTK